jgi:acetolactate synthase-1/2/3 large subunit
VKIKVSDYIANYFAGKGIRTIFTVVGGGAMHMNDSFGHHPMIKCIYNHHEQASAMAAEAYYRVNNEMAGLCVTSGPGAINALNGVAGAYQDSIPMIVVSGQTKTALMTVNSGLDLRTLGNQEFDIMSTLSKVTKFAVTVMNPNDILYYLEKAFYIAQDGRPGPTWIEVPVDIQGAIIDTEKLREYEKNEIQQNSAKLDSSKIIENKIELIIDKLKSAKRPVIYAGNGIRISGAKKQLDALVETLGIPVATCWDSIDLMETQSPYYAGRAGIMGDRHGNFAVQNSDLLIAIGNRLNIYQVGYQLESWAREAYVVDVDIDELELQKKTIRVDLPICYDAGKFMEMLSDRIVLVGYDFKKQFDKWILQCQSWKEKYPVVEKRHYEMDKPLNVYAFIDTFSKKLPEGMITVVANGSASVVGSAAYCIKKDQRFIMNCAISSMGYDLPAAVGACVANGKEPVVCIAGDGSIMMNLQELQTIVTNKLPVKIVLINNNGYQQIRLTQTNLFKKNFVGIGPDSKDLGFPDFEKIAYAFGIPYRRCGSKEQMENGIDWCINEKGYCLFEVFCSTEQIFEPKSATKRLEDGSLYSPPLEDLAPFLSREELKSNMYIKMWDER